MNHIDETHDPDRLSWVASANAPDTDFPLQNLPFGVFRRGEGSPRIGVAIGNQILDLSRAFELDLLIGVSHLAVACAEPSLNSLMAKGRGAARSLRHAVFMLLSHDSTLEAAARAALVPASDVLMLLPAQIGDFTDFYTSVHHATRGANISRPGTPALLPNFRQLPVGYHGRASSIVQSGVPCIRPRGQKGMASTDDRPDPRRAATFGPTAKLDFELEVGFYVGEGNSLGEPISLADSEERIFGLCLVNDWSARDIQRWESQPLGPFLAKSFMTSVSPWVVSLDALAPFRRRPAERGLDAPTLARYLTDTQHAALGAVDINLTVLLTTQQMRERGQPAAAISHASFAGQYWSIFQMLTHHSSNGCNLRSGDLLASGTVSNAEKKDSGCLLEMTIDGRDPLVLPNGETRVYLEDGDEVRFEGRCSRTGFRSIGFGACEGRVIASLQQSARGANGFA